MIKNGMQYKGTERNIAPNLIAESSGNISFPPTATTNSN